MTGWAGMTNPAGKRLILITRQIGPRGRGSNDTAWWAGDQQRQINQNPGAPHRLVGMKDAGAIPRRLLGGLLSATRPKRYRLPFARARSPRQKAEGKCPRGCVR